MFDFGDYYRDHLILYQPKNPVVTYAINPIFFQVISELFPEPARILDAFKPFMQISDDFVLN